MDQTISLQDGLNKLASMVQAKSDKYQAIMTKITDLTEEVLDDHISSQKKFEIIESLEYLLIKLRMDVEFEHLQVKEALSNRDTNPTVRSIFIKRDQLLANYIIKLNNIRDDISVLQKIVYTKSSFSFNK